MLLISIFVYATDRIIFFLSVFVLMIYTTFISRTSFIEKPKENVLMKQIVINDYDVKFPRSPGQFVCGTTLKMPVLP